MAENAEETTTPAAEEAQAPTRRRASRRVTAAEGTVSAPAETGTQAAAPEEAAPAEASSAATPAEAPKKRATRSRKKPVETDPAEAADAQTESTKAASSTKTATVNASAATADAAAETPAEAPKKRATRSRKKAADDTSTPTAEASEKAASGAPTSPEASEEPQKTEAAPTRRRSTRKAADQTVNDQAEQNTDDAAAPTDAQSQPAAGADSADATAGDSQSDHTADDAAASRGRGRRSRTKTADAEADGDKSEQKTDAGDDTSNRGRGRGRGNTRGQDANKTENADGNGDRSGRSDSSRGDQQSRSESSSRSSRTRQRDRKRRGQGDEFEQEITEDDVLLPIAGILDVLDNYAFVRTSGYLPGPSDVYVSLGQVKKYGLRKGDAVVGAIRQPRDNDGGGRQKYNAIVKVDSINGKPVDDNQNREEFSELTPLYPQDRLLLETPTGGAAPRIIDLIAPIGKGQRGLIIGERGTGKSQLLQSIAESVSANAPDAHLIAVLLDERPEEVTELQRQIKGEVVASTFDRSAEDHTTVAELSIERAKRLVELGHDVVVLLDSVTALGRAYAQRPVQGRAANAPVDATVLQPMKSILGSARNIENGGSLTIIATAHEKTGSRTDKVILRELAGTANTEIRLSQELAEDRLSPAIDVRKSYSVRDTQLLGESETQAVRKLREQLVKNDAEDALSALLKQINASTTNAALLAQVARG